TGIPLPHVVVSTHLGQALSGGDGVARTIRDARESDRLTIIDVEHAAECAVRSHSRASLDVEHRPLFAGPADPRLSWLRGKLPVIRLSREDHTRGVAAAAIVVSIADEVIGDGNLDRAAVRIGRRRAAGNILAVPVA